MDVIVTAPPGALVTWEEADAHLRLDGDEDQREYVMRLAAAASAHIDGPTGWLGRAIGPQTLRAALARVEDLLEPLPYPPLIDVVGIQYVDASRQVQTWDPQNYETIGGRIIPVEGAALPAVYDGTYSRSFPLVTVSYRAGFVVDAAANPLVPAVPEPIRHAVLLMIGDMYRFPETASDLNVAPSAIPMSTTVKHLLSPFRKFF